MPFLRDRSEVKMEGQEPTRPNSGEASEWAVKTPQILQAGSMKGLLERRPGDLMSPPGVEGSLSLEQWEAQWKEFLRTVESLPSPWGGPPLPEKPSPWEDGKAFLASFEQVAEACQWPKVEWTTRLLPALSGEVEKAFNNLDARDREDYGKVKAAILREGALSREKQRQQFRRFCYQEAEGPREAYRRLQEMCRGWLRVENHSKEHILELLVMEQLLNVLPSEIQSRVRESGPESCSQAVALAEEFLSRQEKQVPLEEAARNISEAGQDLSENEQRHPSMDIKEEEGLLEAESQLRPVPKVLGFYNSEEKLLLSSGTRKSFPDGKKGNVHITMKASKCFQCGKSFKSESHLLQHQRTHREKKLFQCSECGKCFNWNVSLQRHQRIHTGEKPYESSVCGKRFRSELHLLHHQRTHTGKKPFQCSECGRNFNRNLSLRQHQSIHTGEKPFECSECGKKFCRSGDLHRHQGIHTGEKRFECSECGRKFQQSGTLLQHRRIHTGEKPFECSECGRKFSRNSSRRQHQRVHTGKNQFNIIEESTQRRNLLNAQSMERS